MNDHLPKRFTIFIGGFMGPSYLVEMDAKESVLRYQYFRNEAKKELKIQPTPQQWKKFWIQIDKSKIWSWKVIRSHSGFGPFQWFNSQPNDDVVGRRHWTPPNASLATHGMSIETPACRNFNPVASVYFA